MSYLEGTSQVFTIFVCTALIVLWSLLQEASDGDFCGAVVVAANYDNMKDYFFPVLMRQQVFHSFAIDSTQT